MNTFPHLRTAGWLLATAVLVQSCKKDVNEEGGPTFNLGTSKSFSNCNLPIGTTISVTSFGAVPNDGVDDTEAFILASQAVNSTCNSNTRTVLDIPSGTYDVGRQLTPGQSWTVGTQTFSNNVGSGFSALGVDIITITCCPNVLIRGNGNSKLRFHNGMSFGWDAGCTQRATMGEMVNIQGTKCATVAGLELDGNTPNCNLLAPCIAQDHYQLASDGVIAHSSTYLEITKVYTHHFGRDGLMLYKRQIQGCPYSTNMQYIQVNGVTSEHNSRQGFSWVDGTDLTCDNSSFSHTGSVFYNNPGAGLDIEPDNGGIAARGVFTKCKFEKNRVWGVISDGHPTTVWDIAFNDCDIWHTSSGAAVWVTKGNNFTFSKSRIYGTLLHGGGYSPTQRCSFFGCTITDRGPDGLPCPVFQNILLHQGPGDTYFDFDGCTFDLHYNMLAFVQTMNLPPPYVDRKFSRNVFRLDYPSLSCGPLSNVPVVACGGGNQCNGSRYLAYFRNAVWTRNSFIDSNPLSSAEPNNRNYLIQIGDPGSGNGFANSMDGSNTFQYVAGVNVGHFLRQYSPAGGCWANRLNF